MGLVFQQAFDHDMSPATTKRFDDLYFICNSPGSSFIDGKGRHF